MFARLLGLERSPVSVSASAPVSDHPLAQTGRRARRAPPLPEKNFIPEIEFDRRVAYWAMTRAEPPTATLRPALFEHHVRVTFETDPGLDHARHQMAITAPHLLNKIVGLPVLLAEQAMASLTSVAASISANGTRTSVVVTRFDSDLRERLQAIDNLDIRLMLDYISIERIAARMIAALRDVSQEYILASQLKQTARTIRRLEDLLSREALPDEDLFELKLRRDVFAADLRALTRLVRATLKG